MVKKAPMQASFEAQEAIRMAPGPLAVGSFREKLFEAFDCDSNFDGVPEKAFEAALDIVFPGPGRLAFNSDSRVIDSDDAQNVVDVFNVIFTRFDPKPTW